MVATKKDNTPKIKVSPTVKINFSPVRKNKYANHVDVHQTLCMHVLVVLATRFDRPEGSFLHWMKMAFLDASETLGVLWKITEFPSAEIGEMDLKQIPPSSKRMGPHLTGISW